MDTNYLDFGSSSDSEDDRGDVKIFMSDSDEEDKAFDRKLLEAMDVDGMKDTLKQRVIDDFEAEMEAELDRRAMQVEIDGGMEHQKSMSRSSSSSSLRSIKSNSNMPSTSCLKKTSSSSSLGPSKEKKSVKFSSLAPSTTEGEPLPPGEETTSSSSGQKADTYDPIYFDSDDSEGEDEDKKNLKQNKRKFMSDDDLLYDPQADAKDQAWIDNRRRKSQGKSVPPPPKGTNDSVPASLTGSGPGSSRQPSLPTTDAVLNCPACFTVLCHDCQRHEFYNGQYRAMFVMNCVIVRSETLTVPLKAKKEKFRKRNHNRDLVESVNSPPDAEHNPDSDKYHPVKCKVCSTNVAVYDVEEVYHFFNVLASHP